MPRECESSPDGGGEPASTPRQAALPRGGPKIPRRQVDSKTSNIGVLLLTYEPVEIRRAHNGNDSFELGSVK
jgi:hypothetical protein